MAPLVNGDPVMIGSYRLVGRLGEGGMGQVYLGETPSGRRVAVKLIHAEHVDDPRFRDRFAREVQAAQRVSGFYTAPVLDADPNGDPPWMATAYVPGPALHTLVNDGGPLPPDRVRVLGAGLAEGLAAIHAAGLIHRDLKPSNVIVAEDGPRIIDFGIARALDASTMTATGALIGTLAYMSPEQINLAETGPPSDIFSLGAVLAFAATGHGPFDAPSPGAIVHQVVSAPPVLDGIPPDLRDILARCLAKNPTERPTAPQLITLLAAPAPPTPPSPPLVPPTLPAPPSRPPGEGAPGLPRRALLAGAGGALVLAGAAAFGLSRLNESGGNEIAHRRLPGEFTDLRSLAFSPDGKIIAGGSTQSNSPVLHFWDAAEAKKIAEYSAIPQGVYEVVFTPDGGTLLLAGADGTVRLWRISDRREIAILRGHENGAVNAVAISKQGTIASGGSDGTIRIWDARTLRNVRTITQKYPNLDLKFGQPCYGVAFSPDGRVVASVGAHSSVRLWDPETGQRLAEITTQRPATTVTFSPDGRTLAIGEYGSEDQASTTVLVDATSRRIIGELSRHKSVDAVAFSPSGNSLATADDGTTLELWNASTRSTLKALKAPGRMTTLAFSPNGQSLAAGAYAHAFLLPDLGPVP